MLSIISTYSGFSMPPRGSKQTLEAKLRISAALKGFRKSAEHKRRISEALKGHEHSAETRAKISAKMRGCPNWSHGLTKDTDCRIAKISAANKGVPKSPEHKAKLSALHKGRPFTPNATIAAAKVNRGKKRSPETCRKIAKKVKAARKRNPWPSWNKGLKGAQTAWNKGLTKDTDQRVAAYGKKRQGKVPFAGTWPYIGKQDIIEMRSKWEVAYAQYLDRTGIRWQYEAKCFYIGKGKWVGEGYIPDFYLVDQDRYIEVKGFLSSDAKRKYAAFKKLYPDIKWKMLNCSALKKLGVLDIHGCAILETANSGVPGN